MSATASVTLVQPQTSHSHSSKCPNCGTSVLHPQLQSLEEAQLRIKELESQISILTLRATSAVEKANEYETSLRRLNSTRSNDATIIQPASRGPSFEGVQAPMPSAVVTNNTSINTTAPAITPQSPPKPMQLSAASRLARLLPSRSASTASAPHTSTGITRPLPTPHASYPLTAGFDPSSLPQNANQDLPLNLPASALASPSPSELSLISALTHEQSLRKAAESAAAQTNNEIEELTGQLFEQANEMVAQERKARAKLEERVNVLEKREGEKSQRLQTLERRIGRVERVRGLLERELAIGTGSPGNPEVPNSKNSESTKEGDRKQP